MVEQQLTRMPRCDCIDADAQNESFHLVIDATSERKIGWVISKLDVTDSISSKQRYYPIQTKTWKIIKLLCQKPILHGSMCLDHKDIRMMSNL